jgi:hypothetical protein
MLEPITPIDDEKRDALAAGPWSLSLSFLPDLGLCTLGQKEKDSPKSGEVHCAVVKREIADSETESERAQKKTNESDQIKSNLGQQEIRVKPTNDKNICEQEGKKKERHEPTQNLCREELQCKKRSGWQ